MKAGLFLALVLSFMTSIAQAQRLAYSVSREKNSIVHYRSKTVGVVTLIEGKKYEVLNPHEPIVLYRTFEQNGKWIVARHFFSTPASEVIKPLTLQNLKSDFPDQQEFHQKLDMLARNNHELIKYRECINRIYQNTLMN